MKVQQEDLPADLAALIAAERKVVGPSDDDRIRIRARLQIVFDYLELGRRRSADDDADGDVPRGGGR